MTDDLDTFVRRLRGPARYDDLSPRQQHYLRLRAHGLSYKDIAAAWGVHVQTVKNHAGRTYARLGVTSCIEALHEVGWICVPDVPSQE